MSIKSLGLKVSLIVALMITALVVVVAMILNSQSDYLVKILSEDSAHTANVAFVNEIETLEKETITLAGIIANIHEIVVAVQERDIHTLEEELHVLGGDMDIITLCDENGDVILRTHSDQKGDNVLNQRAIEVALRTGEGISTIEGGTAAGLATRGSAAIKDYDGNIIGAIVCGHDLSNPKYVDELKEKAKCEATLFAGDTRYNTTLIGEDGNRVVGTKASDFVIDTVIKNRQDYALQIELFGHNYSAYYSPLIIEDEVVGMLFTGVTIEYALENRDSMFNSVLLAAILCGAACIIFVFVFNIFSVSRPLKKLGAYAEKIRDGDLGISASSDSKSGVRSKDEVGELAKTLEQAYAQLKGYVSEISERMHSLEQGDLVTESAYEFKGDFVLIKDSINNIVRNLNGIMSEINTSAAQVSTGSKQVADGAQALAQGSTEQAASVQQLSSSIMEIAEKTKTNAALAGKAATLADTIKGNAEKGSHQMDDMMNAVNEINTASQSISNVIKTIDDIAFQTNILALNAAVEAARAGSAGKGFAVVAEEVRNLAAKSAEAAKDTGGLIENSISKANVGVKIAGETAQSLSEIVSGINESTQLVGEIAKSSEEQSAGIAQINIGIDQVTQVVQRNSATAEESAAASEEMSGQSDVLQQLITQFRISEKDDFLLGDGKK